MSGTTARRTAIRRAWAGALAVLLAFWAVASTAAPVQAATPPASESHGLDARVNLLGGLIPLTLTSEGRAAYPAGPATAGSTNLGGLGSVGLVDGTATGSASDGTTQATSRVAGLQLLQNVLEVNAVTSGCTADGGGTTTTSNVAGLTVLGVNVPVATAPNTTVDVLGLVTLTFNETTSSVSGGRYTTSVNALHVTANVLGVLTGDITIAHSECAADARIPTVTGVAPSSGPEGGGTSVTITGTGFTAATGVSFGGTPAASFTVTDGGHITAVAPPGTPGTVPVSVANRTGTSTANGTFTYLPAPAVGGVSPGAGPLAGGGTVTITGTDLTGATGVSFGGTPATGFTVDSSTRITATVPAGTAGTVDVRVTTPNGTSPVTAADRYRYAAAPAVTGIAPRVGPTAGGNQVVVTGTDLDGATAVSFGGTPATSFTVDSPTRITAVAPAGTGSADVRITTPGGTSPNVAADDYLWADGPVVTGIAPSGGPLTGGTPVVITGTDLGGATAVRFGSTPATSFTVVSPTRIDAVAPAGSAGTVSVRVTTPAGTSPATSADDYTYRDVPAVGGVVPSTGPLTGGTTVTITGTDLGGATGVTFGATGATGFTVDSPTQITAVAPAGTGTVAVRVTTAGGTSPDTAADDYAYAAVPAVTALSAHAGPLDGGATVVVTGTDLSGTSGVSFGPTAARSFTVDSPTQITAVSPAGVPGTVAVRVTTPGGTSNDTAADDYAYVDEPAVSDVSPAAGPVAGGTSVVVTGTDLTGATAVRFGATPATSFTVDSPTRITAVAPAGTAGTVDVRVTTPGGTSPSSTADRFAFVDVPAVSGISPTGGPLGGGNAVVITGTALDRVSGISFGATPATSFTVDSPTRVTAIAPVGAAGTVDVRVTSPGGTSPVSPADRYTYTHSPGISGLSAEAGPVAGGTTVVITGTDLAGATAVDFGGTPASSFTVDSPTRITAMSPPGTAGTVHLRVTTPAGSSPASPADQFTYANPPAVSRLSPDSGPVSGGTAVLVRGSDLSLTSAVDFGGIPASTWTVVSPSEVTATVPPGTAGDAVVHLTTPGGTTTATWSYRAVPVVGGLDVHVGPTSGGTTVTITGTGLDDASEVRFGTTPAASFSVDSPTQITAVAPAGTAGSVPVEVTTPGGTSSASPASAWTWAPRPVVGAVLVPMGPAAGGSTVVITGSGFTATTAVTFGSLPATSFTVDSANRITAVTPASPAGRVDVRVTTAGGTSTVAAGDAYTYLDAPVVGGLSPSTGATTGGTLVTITGTDLSSVTGVSFGGVPATTFVVISPTRITALAPAGSSGTVDVRVTTLGGTSAAVPASRYTYELPVVQPTPTPTPSPTASPTPSPTATPTPTPVTTTAAPAVSPTTVPTIEPGVTPTRTTAPTPSSTGTGTGGTGTSGGSGNANGSGTDTGGTGSGGTGSGGSGSGGSGGSGGTGSEDTSATSGASPPGATGDDTTSNLVTDGDRLTAGQGAHTVRNTLLFGGLGLLLLWLLWFFLGGRYRDREADTDRRRYEEMMRDREPGIDLTLTRWRQ